MGKIEWSNHPRNQRHFWELWMLICCTSFAMRVQKWDISAVKSTMFFSKPFSQRTACLLHIGAMSLLWRDHSIFSPYLPPFESIWWLCLNKTSRLNSWNSSGDIWMHCFRTQSLVSFVSTIALWCDFSWKMPLKLKKEITAETCNHESQWVSLGGTWFPSQSHSPAMPQVCLFCFWDVPWINLDPTLACAVVGSIKW